MLLAERVLQRHSHAHGLGAAQVAVQLRSTNMCLSADTATKAILYNSCMTRRMFSGHHHTLATILHHGIGFSHTVQGIRIQSTPAVCAPLQWWAQ